ncbi:MAG: hypothetical protein CMK07_14345 [Ponticaulis sp.]|nr:hypothetical protein [Ponticaulis sp.]
MTNLPDWSAAVVPILAVQAFSAPKSGSPDMTRQGHIRVLYIGRILFRHRKRRGKDIAKGVSDLMADETYFETLSGALDTAGIATPRLIIDRSRLDRNIDCLKNSLSDETAFRVVVKSLPSTELISRVMKKTRTDRLMTFNLPMLKFLSEHYPMADQLLGKPLPARAMDSFFSKIRPRNVLAHQNVQWLVDTEARLTQYLDIAERYATRIRVSLEIDIGLHRGGLVPGEELDRVLSLLADHTRADLSGIMGYDLHVAHMQPDDGSKARADEHAKSVYREVLNRVEHFFGTETLNLLVRNAAGSQTYSLWANTDLANEVALGSALVKPSNFDCDALAEFEPACFIATPVLKTWPYLALPGETATSDASTTVFTYGGYWKADPVYPDGLSYHSDGRGRSSNQDMLLGNPGVQLAPDDFVFLRPRQSEAVFLQFGEILVYEDGQIVDEWPVLPPSA